MLFLILLLSTSITVINYSSKYEMTTDEGDYIYNAFLLSSGMKTYDFFYQLQKTPGIIWLQFPIIKIFGNTFLSIFILRFISHIIAILAIIMIFLIGKKLVNAYVGIFAALFFAIDTVVIGVGGAAAPSIYSTFLLTLVFYFYIKGTKKNIFISGLFLTAAILFRPTSLVMLFPIFLFEISKYYTLRNKFANLFLFSIGSLLILIPFLLYLLTNGVFYNFISTLFNFNYYDQIPWPLFEKAENIFYNSIFKNPLAWTFTLIGIVSMIKLKQIYKWRFVILWAASFMLSFFLWRSFFPSYLTDLISPISLIAGFGAYVIFIDKSYLKSISKYSRKSIRFCSFLIFIVLFIFILVINFADPYYDADNMHKIIIDYLNHNQMQNNSSFITTNSGVLFLLGIKKDIDKVIYFGKGREEAYKLSGLEDLFGKRVAADIINYLEKNKIQIIVFSKFKESIRLDEETRKYILENYEPVYYDKNKSTYYRIKSKVKKILRKYLLFTDTRDESQEYVLFIRKST